MSASSALTPQRCKELLRILSGAAQRAERRGDQEAYREVHKEMDKLLELMEAQK
jgi:hypothetical protein